MTPLAASLLLTLLRGAALREAAIAAGVPPRCLPPPSARPPLAPRVAGAPGAPGAVGKEALQRLLARLPDQTKRAQPPPSYEEAGFMDQGPCGEAVEEAEGAKERVRRVDAD